MSLIRSAATVGGTTFLSRILGFVRDMMVASAIGTGPIADAFFVAFRFPNMFRSIFAEGAFNSAFVPLFAKRLEGEGEASARRFAEEATSALLFVLLVLTILAMVFMPALMHVFAPGFGDDPQKRLWAVQFSRITFPYLLFISLTAVQAAILNSLGKFFAGAAAPVMLNVTMIVALFFVVPLSANPGLALSWGVCVAGVVQFIWLAISCQRAGMTLHLRRPRLTPDVKRLVTLGIPGIIAGGIGQVNLTVGTMIATLQAGAVSWLYYADRIYQLPLGVVGIAIGVVLLPDLSRRLRANDDEGAHRSLNRALEFAMLLTVPAAVALAVIPYDIIKVLFERGRFHMGDTDATAIALAIYAVGLPAFVMNKVFSPAFFARENTWTPLKFAGLSVAVNVAASFFLFQFIGFAGIAWGTTIAAWTNTIQLGFRLWRHGHFAPDAQLKQRLPLTLLASAGMGAVLWVGSLLLAPAFELHFLASVCVLAGLIGGGGLVYAGFCEFTGAAKLADIRKATRRG
ncbi:MAG: murein biosynthesis integral membrane protein MurJ [Parvibaculum sp.]|uniref:murein biosynthesis integral membrane protein MurJ n=1 Tax=Parvibaculum sp. TaxID=2024848 RepID=UPI0025F4CA00|nr:murein biosynthesis integral membrane protein MurJ [Parvibaculum sp.]MCE9648155.1 murein biosynthesis integral membrane protein MurJ [Parvibaculum sp.]